MTRCGAPLRFNPQRPCRRAVRPGAGTCWSHRLAPPGPGRKLLVHIPTALWARLEALVATGLYGDAVDEALLTVARDRVVDLCGPLVAPRRR